MDKAPIPNQILEVIVKEFQLAQKDLEIVNVFVKLQIILEEVLTSNLIIMILKMMIIQNMKILLMKDWLMKIPVHLNQILVVDLD